MNELDAILSICRTEPEAARGGVLATVVHVKGSAYRRPGARMLILADGRRIGTVSGGCLEGDVSKKAWWFTEDGRPAVRAYDTSSDDDAVWEFGMGCNGVVTVLFERVDSAETQETLRFLATHRALRRGAVIATVVAASPASRARIGERLLVEAAGACGGSLRGSPLEAEILARATVCFLHQKSCLVHLAGCDVFVEWIGAPVPLVVFGAGHDAIPLVKFAKELGWHVTVADGRPNYAQASRFPDADRIVFLRREDLLAGIEITRESMVVLMTHNYPMDVKLVERILRGKPRYLGLLGPRARGEKLLAEAGQPVHGVDVHAPVGLDLGSDTPETIALSIIAEVQASLSGRRGGMLKWRDDAIHVPAEEIGRAAETVALASENAVCELV
jgi:xanthine/CO dehydrogenase XdhC/CoxF family maturation factor